MFCIRIKLLHLDLVPCELNYTEARSTKISHVRECISNSSVTATSVYYSTNAFNLLSEMKREILHYPEAVNLQPTSLVVSQGDENIYLTLTRCPIAHKISRNTFTKTLP